MDSNCDFSPMKEQVKTDLSRLVYEINQSIENMNNENFCLLGKFEQLKEQFTKIQSVAGSFYLMCYLSSYTDNFLDLSIAISNLSERRHGALIVVQREDHVDRLIQSGTPIGATLTSSLLETIFFPGSALHDGAVLVKDNKIVSAANVLPNVHQYASNKKLGTRHRAAMGLTEKCDALVLVVSEETGNASFAFQGNLYPLKAVDPIMMNEGV